MFKFLKNKFQSGKPSSRKWFLVLLVVILATIGCYLPPALSMWVFGFDEPLVILSGTEFVSILTLIVSIYFGINVWQKKIEKKDAVSEESEEEIKINAEDKEV